MGAARLGALTRSRASWRDGVGSWRANVHALHWRSPLTTIVLARFRMRLKTIACRAPSTLAAVALLPVGISPRVALQPSEPIADAQSSAILLAVGDIAGCPERYQDEATAELVAGAAGHHRAAGRRGLPERHQIRVPELLRPQLGQGARRGAGLRRETTSTAPMRPGRTTSTSATRAGPAGKGYYTYKLGAWRIYSLNSERAHPRAGGLARRRISPPIPRSASSRTGTSHSTPAGATPTTPPSGPCSTRCTGPAPEVGAQRGTTTTTSASRHRTPTGTSCRRAAPASS